MHIVQLRASVGRPHTVQLRRCIAGIPFNMTVVSERIPISVFDAFCIVVAAGGGKALTDSKRWPVVTHAILDPRPPPSGMPLHMRHLYEMYVEVILVSMAAARGVNTLHTLISGSS